MKKVSYFIVASLFLASTAFVSCSKDDDIEKPSIIINLNGTDQQKITVDQGATVTYRIDYNAPGKLKQIDFKQVNGSNLTGFPKTSGFKSDVSDQITGTFPTNVAGTIKYITEVTDKEGQSTNKEIEIVVNATSTSNPINEWLSKTLGSLAHSTTTGSSCASATGDVWLLPAAKTNSNKVDFIYFNGATNKQSIAAPSNSDVQNLASSSADKVSTWTTKNDTKLSKLSITAAEFDAISNDAVINEKVTTTTVTGNIVSNLAAGDVIGFITASTSVSPGKKGLIKIESFDTANNNAVVSIKVQK